MNSKSFNVAWLLCAVGCAAWLSGCAPVNDVQKKVEREAQTVFPAPPDPPRFEWEGQITGSWDIASPRKSRGIRGIFTGEAEEGGDGLAKPYAVAVFQGRVYVTDSVDRFVKVFDFPGRRFFKIGDDPKGSLAKPMGIDVDASGNIYVADITQKAVMVYAPDGTFLRKIGRKGDFERLTSVTIDRQRQRLLVVDIGGVSSQQHRVRVYDAPSGNHLFDFGKRGTGPGEFNLPRDAAIGKDGLIYVVDGGNFRVQVFDKDGKYVSAFGSIGKQLGNFARPKEVATDKDGNIYVVDSAFGNFQIFNPEGELMLFIGERSEKNGPAKYMLPSGIYVDEDGRIYMVDQWFRKVDVFRPYDLPADAGFLSQPPVTVAKPK
ncbi:MAG: 6-bladed beta-propeller [Betaproteobacteria bacterium]|nr:6-bladed beta-propeller [Betaproteobacteria bacterium]